MQRHRLPAGEAVPLTPRDDAALAARLRALPRGDGGGDEWFAPRTSDELADLLLAHPHARIVAGATDVALWVTKQYRGLATVIFLGDVADLRDVREDADGVTIGAGVTYSAARGALTRLHPDLGALLRRIAGVQVRNMGTIGGNIANGSPIGDMPPALIALGATLTLRRGGERRRLPLEEYFIDYGRQDRRTDEFVERIHVPRPAAGSVVRIVKLSKRFDGDISAVCGAVMLDIAGDTVVRARVAFGGMAATPRRALACEAALAGAPYDGATFEAAAVALGTDYAPLDDLRGSATYRRIVAANVLRRMWAERAGPVSVLADLDD